jgi:hypothetical protein
MTRIPAPLIGALSVCLVGLAVACSGSSTAPEIGNGPAENVKGVWEGDYTGADTSPSGTFCLSFQQDNRQLAGSIAFDGGEPAELNGLIAEDRLSFVWGPLASATSAVGTNISSGGGTFSGNVSAGTVSGTYTVAGTADHGAWTGHLSDKRAC